MKLFDFNLNIVKVCAAAVMLTAASAAMAVPATPNIIDYVQPDGSIIKIQLRGDENGHYIQDTHGTPLVKDERGFLMPISSELRSAALVSELPKKKKYLFSGAAFPSEGSPRALVILVEFTDKHFSMLNPNGFYRDMLNKEGFSRYNATGSARDFFVENSSGKFTPDFDVYGPVTLSNAMSYYGSNDSWGYDMHPEEAVVEACKKLDSTVDFSIYDANGDGQIDNVFIFYAGYGEADSGIDDTIWPHSADLDDFELGADFIFDGVKLNRYGMSNEIDYAYKRPDGIGTFVHEFSHVMGLPDLYNTLYLANYTPGEYSTLDYGPYNNKGLTPPHYSAFERYSLGWISPREITSTGTYTLEPLHKSNDAIILHTEKQDEFFLLENRQQECCDKYIPGHGMLIWHIDFVQDIWDKNVVNNTPTHQYVDIVEANRRSYATGEKGYPFPGTSKVTSIDTSTLPALQSWSATALDVTSISNITESTDGLISFRATLRPGASVADVTGSDSLILISGSSIQNISDDSVSIYSVTGARIASVSAGDSIELPCGVYIVNGVAGKSDKIMIK